VLGEVGQRPFNQPGRAAGPGGDHP
jgi:hypothetical protein